MLESQGFLLGLDGADPWTLGGVAAVLVAVMALATWEPACRAVSVEPFTRCVRSRRLRPQGT